MASVALRPAIPINQGFEDKYKQEALEYALPFMKEAKESLRHQIGILYQKSLEYYKIKGDSKYKLMIDDIAHLLTINGGSEVSKHTVQFHYQRFKAEGKGLIGENGRPKPLTDEQVEEIGKYIKELVLPPTPNEIMQYINDKYHKKVDTRS